MTDLPALLERVKAATGPDRSVDAFIAEKLGGLKYGPCVRKREGFVWRNEEGDTSDLPRYTASIDAAIALKDRMLPGWTIANLSQQDDKSWFCELREGYLTSYNRVAMSETALDKRPANLPLAIIAATLQALIAKGES